MKKGNFRILAVALALIVVSVGLLTGSMYALAALPVGEKAYEREDFIDESLFLSDESTQPESSANQLEPPVPQKELWEMFSAMYETDEEAGSIAVISESFLQTYWSDDTASEIRSLKTEEVFFIISDSIRIYNEYQEIVLPAYELPEAIREIADAFPTFGGRVIRPTTEYPQAALDIYDIIVYRMVALSSPESILTCSEAMQAISVSGKPDRQLGQGFYYLPGYSPESDRAEVVEAVLWEKPYGAFGVEFFSAFHRNFAIPDILYCLSSTKAVSRPLPLMEIWEACADAIHEEHEE